MKTSFTKTAVPAGTQASAHVDYKAVATERQQIAVELRKALEALLDLYNSADCLGDSARAKQRRQAVLQKVNQAIVTAHTRGC